jgi:hypothetical protein
MWRDLTDKIQERAANIVDLLTSKKALVAVGAAVLIVWGVSALPKVVAIAGVAIAYLLAQGYVDGKKEE